MESLTNLVVPSNAVILLGLIGIVLSLRPQWRRVATLLLWSAAVLLVILASGKTATALSSPLEYAFAKAPAPQDHPDAKEIVMLGAYGADDPNMPLSSKLNPSAMFRVVETVHLWRACLDCTVIVTGLDP